MNNHRTDVSDYKKAEDSTLCCGHSTSKTVPLFQKNKVSGSEEILNKINGSAVDSLVIRK